MKVFKTVCFSLISLATTAQVGIGTESPSAPLDIEADDAAIDINSDAAVGSRDPQIHFQLSGTSTFSLGIDDADSDKFKIGTTAPETGTALTIDASQNVGIGNTSPSATLDVDGSAIFNESGAAVDFRVEGDTETHLLFADASADNVGIGTSTPATKLDIHGGGIDIDSDDDGDGCGIFEYGDGLGLSAYINSSNDPLIVLGGGNAYVGIKNTSPNANLDVDGSAIFNDSGADVDFRVEGDTESHLLFVDASTDMVGIGTSSPASGLDIQTSLGYAVATITSATTLNQTHNVVLCNTGSYTVTLPAAASNTGKVYYIKNIDATDDDITIDGNGAETIDGETTIVLYSQYDAVRIVSNGTNWNILSDERKAHACAIYRSAAQSIPNNTETKIVFDDEEFDIGDIGDVTTDGRIEIVKDGTYSISASYVAAGLDDQEEARIRIQKNGASYIAADFGNFVSSGFSNWITANASTVVQLSAGDYIELYVKQNSGGSLNTATSDRSAQPSLIIHEVKY